MANRYEQVPKKAYEPPALTIYGKVHEMTKTILQSRKNPDNPMNPNTTTGFIG